MSLGGRIKKMVYREYFPEIWYAAERWLTTKPSAEVLTVGTMRGLLTQALVRTQNRVTVVDPEVGVLQETHRRMTKIAAEVTLAQSDLSKLPFASASFDVVFCSHMLEVAESPSCTLREFARVLRPEGLLITVNVSPFGIWRFRRVFSQLHKGFNGLPTQKWQRDRLLSELDRAGFLIESFQRKARYLPILTPGLNRFRLPFANSYLCLAKKKVFVPNTSSSEREVETSP